MTKNFITPFFLGLAFFGAGCLPTATKPTSQGPDLGIWKSVDAGVTWVQKKALITGAKVSTSLASMSILDIVTDPQDNQALYLATAANGLVYSLDGGESWQQPKALAQGRVDAIAIDPKNKCTLYASAANKIYKTETCMRDWRQVFFDPRSTKLFSRILVDWYNPQIIYAGTSAGDIFKSIDAGEHWEVSTRSKSPIVGLVMDPKDSRVIYAATASQGLLKTVDAGATWVEIRKQFEKFSIKSVAQVVIDPKDSLVLYVVASGAILKSGDGGQTWEALPLTVPAGQIRLQTLSIDPKNTNHLIFAGLNTLQISEDGGSSWAPKKLPTTQMGNILKIDPTDSKVVYLGVVSLPKK